MNFTKKNPAVPKGGGVRLKEKILFYCCAFFFRTFSIS